MSDLKHCAHCGGESTVGYYPETPGMEHEPWAAHCDKCKAVIWAETKAEAIEAWNRRANDASSD